ncbi:MAG: amino acid permease, partial [Thermocrispum sp.]
VHPRFGGPHHAELAVGAAVALLAATVDLRGAIGFSAFAVLAYYAIANSSALTLPRGPGRPPVLVPLAGLVGCLALGASLPTMSVLSGLGVLGVGAAVYAVRRIVLNRRR